jgi:Glycosyltransferase
VRTVLFVGALSPLKGIRELLAVSEDLAPSIPHRLRVVGTGPLATEVASTARRLDHVTCVGALGRDAVRNEMRAADVLVLPTRHLAGRAEAAGLVLLEAQACGTPVIANAVGGTPEMMVDGATGFATDENDPATLRAALRTILSMPPDELASMGTRARDWVVTERSLSRSVAELRCIYGNLVD